MKKPRKRRKPVLEYAILLVMAFLVIAIFLGFLGIEQDSAVQPVKASGMLLAALEDGTLSKSEIAGLTELSCDDLRSLLGTEKKVCIYLTDADNNIVDITKDGGFGFGCPGLVIQDKRLCSR